jgi:hypothetical protein
VVSPHAADDSADVKTRTAGEKNKGTEVLWCFANTIASQHVQDPGTHAIVNETITSASHAPFHDDEERSFDDDEKKKEILVLTDS